MKKLMITTTFMTFLLACQILIAQSATRATAPYNPQALKYTATHFGYLGPVKTVVNMSFDKQGKLTNIKGDDAQIFTYLKDEIVVEKYGNIYHYTVNNKNQITGFTIEGSDEKGNYTYDTNGNLIEEKSYFSDYSEHITYSYDAQNRVVSKTELWDGSPNRVDLYEYYGEPENLVVLSMLKDDSSSETKYYYKNGVLYNYVYSYSGASEMEDVKVDTNGNVISYSMPAYGDESNILITYYQ
jgi:hypothetical protein